MFDSRLRKRAAVVAIGTGLALGACSGAIDGKEDEMPGSPPGAGGAEGSRTGGSGAAPPVVAPGTPDPMVVPPERMTSMACKGVDPGPQVIRRLNRFEYNNTIRDLLGDSSAPAGNFPTEEKRSGFDNNAEALTISPLLSEQYMLTAERLAVTWLDRNFERLAMTYGCGDVSTATAEDACARRFIQTFGKRAYRRPVPPEDLQILTEVYTAGRTGLPLVQGFRNGIKLAMMTMLQSPRFLYRVEVGLAPRPGEAVVRLDPYETVTRLSYLLWGSQPDSALLNLADAAAQQMRSLTKEEIAAQVNRMLADRRAREMVARFHDLWLDLERIDTIEKDTRVFSSTLFNRAVAIDMGRETDRFLADVIWNGAGDLAALFSAPYTFVNANLARLYGLAGFMPPVGTDGRPQNDAFVKFDLDGATRGGFLTQGTFMASLAGGNQTSPVRRGQFVREHLLCQHLPPPPPNEMIELPPLDSRLTTRERFVKHATDPACSGCHSLMDPIGLGFENFDAIGRYRTTENGKPIDASGEVKGLSGWDGKFRGAVELGKRLAEQPEVRECVARTWFRYAYGRNELDQIDDCSLDVMRRRFAEGGFKIKDLLAALATTDAFLYRRVSQAGGAR